MIWQDAVLTVGSVFFTATLLPTCFDRRTAMPRYKSAPTAFWLATFAVVQWTMGLRVVPFTELVCAGCWAFIAWRRAFVSPRETVVFDGFVKEGFKLRSKYR